MLEINDKLQKEYPKLYHAALEEFGSHSYNDASLNSILKAAKMSKGSFYHNIGDKKNLYLMLISCIGVRKLEIWQGYVSNNLLPENFFDKFRVMTLANCDFILKEPLMYKFFMQFTKEPESFMKELYSNYSMKDYDIWRNIVEEGYNRGDFRKDISVDMILCFIDSTTKSITSMIKDGMTIEDIKVLFDQYINVLKDALASKQ